MPEKNHKYRCNENGLTYRVIHANKTEVIATTPLKLTEENDSFSWLGSPEDFQRSFDRIK